jgi:hypothetical protein
MPFMGEGVTVGPLLYADDNLAPLALETTYSICYARFSLYMMNIQQSAVLTLSSTRLWCCVSTSLPLSVNYCTAAPWHEDNT